MNKQFITLLSKRLQPIITYIDQDTEFEVLDTSEALQEEVNKEYIRCNNEKNKSATYLKELSFLRSRLTNARLGVPRDTPKGSAINKEINAYLSYLADIIDALKSIDAKYELAIMYYNRMM